MEFYDFPFSWERHHPNWPKKNQVWLDTLRMIPFFGQDFSTSLAAPKSVLIHDQEVEEWWQSKFINAQIQSSNLFSNLFQVLASWQFYLFKTQVTWLVLGGVGSNPEKKWKNSQFCQPVFSPQIFIKNQPKSTADCWQLHYPSPFSRRNWCQGGLRSRNPRVS